MTKMMLVLAAALILFLPAARADGSDGTIFAWTFNLTFIGDNACGPSGSGVGTSPCVETFNGSFETEYTLDGLELGYVVGSGLVTTTGPLSGFGCCYAPSYSADGVLEMFGSGGTEVDLGTGTIAFVQPPPGTHEDVGTIYTCPAGTCANDFFSGVPQLFNNLNGPYGFGTVTIREMPEPPMLAMMLLGILPLAFVRRRRA
ncbi:MAG: hypothetical protein ABSB66_09630 [Candidatus Acidiferrales bacterium]|jgi:hypothetical protein